MGCSSSTGTAVQTLTPEKVNGEQNETGSKQDGRGDSAVSKGTADSGVVMENRDFPPLPGEVPRKLPPLTRVRESEADRITEDGLPVQERQKSSDILEELLNQGIIPEEQTRQGGSGAGEAYSIMLDNREGIRRRPPARLESLKAKKALSHHSREEIEEKIRLAEERRKSREDELKTRLRSARVRGPAPVSSTEEDEDSPVILVEPLQPPLAPEPLDPLDPLAHSQTSQEAAEGTERVREAEGGGKECKEEKERVDRRRGGEEGESSGDMRADGAERVSQDSDREDEEEVTQVEELRKDQLLTASGELETDLSFQQAEGKEETF